MFLVFELFEPLYSYKCVLIRKNAIFKVLKIAPPPVLPTCDLKFVKISYGRALAALPCQVPRSYDPV